MTCSHMSYFFISKQLLWELFFRISNSNAVPKKLLFEHTSIEETYKKAKVGISFYKAQGASDFPLPNPLTLIINVKSGEEWGMQYALTSVGKIFTRPVNNGVFTDWIQV